MIDFDAPPKKKWKPDPGWTYGCSHVARSKDRTGPPVCADWWVSLTNLEQRQREIWSSNWFFDQWENEYNAPCSLLSVRIIKKTKIPFLAFGPIQFYHTRTSSHPIINSSQVSVLIDCLWMEQVLQQNMQCGEVVFQKEMDSFHADRRSQNRSTNEVAASIWLLQKPLLHRLFILWKSRNKIK